MSSMVIAGFSAPMDGCITFGAPQNRRGCHYQKYLAHVEIECRMKIQSL